MQNPFTPSFGVSPPLLVGRDDVLARFGEALEEGLDHRAERPSIPARGVLEGPSFSRRSRILPARTVGRLYPRRLRPALLSGLSTSTFQVFSASTILRQRRPSCKPSRHRSSSAAPRGARHRIMSVPLDSVGSLRRADRYQLGRVSLADVSEAITTPIVDAGRSISAELSQRAAESTDGYPFLIQLVGYHLWRLHPVASDVSADDVDVGIMAAQRRLGSLVVEPSLADLSNVDRTFLLAMAQDDGPSRMTDIASRLNCDANYASQYRL